MSDHITRGLAVVFGETLVDLLLSRAFSYIAGEVRVTFGEALALLVMGAVAMLLLFYGLRSNSISIGS
jgi:hypothetical protein